MPRGLPTLPLPPMAGDELPGASWSEQPQGNQGNEGASETGNQMLRRGRGGASSSALQPDAELRRGQGTPPGVPVPGLARRWL